MKILCIMAKGFEEGEALMPVALLRRGSVEVDMVTLDGNEVSGKHDISVNRLDNINDVNTDDYGMLMLPGGPHWPVIEKDDRVRSIIKDFFEKDKYVAAICAAPTILGRMGYLKGKNYTCFTSMNDDFGGTYYDQYVVQDGKLITGRSVAASIDFGLLMLRAAAGKEICDQVKERIYY